jgi:hypothetical protein
VGIGDNEPAGRLMGWVKRPVDRNRPDFVGPSRIEVSGQTLAWLNQWENGIRRAVEMAERSAQRSWHSSGILEPGMKGACAGNLEACRRRWS